MRNVGRLIDTYRYLLTILMKHAPMVVIMVLMAAVLSGLLTPFTVYINSRIFDISLQIARAEAPYSALLPYLLLFVICSLMPNLLSLFINGIAEQRTILVLRSEFKKEMLKKLKRMKYEHLEREDSMEIIDKAYSRAENAARHLFPMYVNYAISSAIGALGSLYILMTLKWWLIFPIVLPFVIETILTNRSSYNIYVELESYWKREKEYGILQTILQNREYIRENRLNQSSDFLIDTYKKRFQSRNKEYERFFFKNLKHIFLSSNISRVAVLGNALILLVLYAKHEISIGLFISISLMIFNSLYNQLDGSVYIFKWGHYHANFFEYYKKYFALSEDEQQEAGALPETFDITFQDVWFRYPGTERDILKGLSFTIGNQEKVSIVGENGEGKSTMVKLLLGLFQPDKGSILIGGKQLSECSLDTRIKLFGSVFQEFNRFQISLEENIVIGDLSDKNNEEKLQKILEKVGLSEIMETLPQKKQTMLGKEFEGGTDLSGGQWQRIALARALYGDKPILILDEPTSQLDPLAESALYSEFSELAQGKTSLFITHRLGSTAITDRIIVIADGVVAQSGTHEELLAAGGLYAAMFESQKSWYQSQKEVGQHAGSH